MEVGAQPFLCFPGPQKQTTLPFKPVKKMKRNPWSDSGSDSESGDFEAPSKRERVLRQAAGERRRAVRRGPGKQL